MGYASKDIRNILVAGHAGCGKTTLTEALLYMSGASERMGRVEDGTTASDFDPEEIRRKASLNSSVVPVEYEGIKYNLIDAPGLFDFETGAAEGIMAAESVLICVSGRSGVTVGAEKAYQLALKNNKARMIFVTKADLENADYFKILEQMKIKFGPSVCPCVVPVRLDDGTVAYINLFSQKAFKYEGGKQVQIDLPDIGHRFEGLIQAMSEAIAETDEALMEKFFEGEAFTTEEIVQGMASGVRSGQITPVFCGSAVNAQALDMLLYNMNVLLPGADTASAVGESGGEPVEITADPAAPLCAYVFKTVADPFVGKLSYLRVISGKVTGGAALVNARTGETEKISKPLTVIGKKQVETDGIGAGDIGAVAKLVSAKTGDGVPDVLEAIVERLPAPEGNPNAPLKALIFDSWYDSYQGVVVMFRIMDGTLRKGDKIELFATKKTYEVIRLGVFSPESRDMDQLSAGEVGFLCGNIKELGDAKVGDTITLAERPCAEAVPGFKEVKAVVFCGLYPSDPSDYEQLKFALEKLQLNDAAFSWEPETSQALGFGFRCGFLGLLHMEIIQERLEREFQVDLIATAPSVIYRVETTDGKTTEIDNPSKLPDPARITNLYEPYVRIDIHVPSDYVGNVMKLCEEKRGIQKNMGYLAQNRVVITYELPFAEIVFDFFDRLKSATRGYASMDYEVIDYRASNLVRLDILLNGEAVDALAVIVHKDKSYAYGRALALKLKRTIPRQMFEIPVQAAIGGKVIARETIKALRKDVLAKCYGGDITRKRKLLEKQKAGKKRMKMLGHVEVPQEAFIAALSTGEDSNDRDTKDKIRAAQKTEG